MANDRTKYGLEHAGPKPDPTLEISKRAFHAICKVIADGVPNAQTVGATDEWRTDLGGIPCSRVLTEHEIKAAIRMAIWVEAAAKELSEKELNERSMVLKALLAKEVELRKYSNGLTSEGRTKGGQITAANSQAYQEWLKKPVFDYFRSPASSGKSDGDVAQYMISMGLDSGLGRKHPYSKRQMTRFVKALRTEYVAAG